MVLNLAYKLSRIKFIGKILRWVYHRIQWTKKTKGWISLNDILLHIDKSAHTPEFSNKTIDIIIPVFNAYDHLITLLDSIYNNSDVQFNLIIIDDKSTDERVSVFLKMFSSEHENINLVHNEKNLGFVKTVNKGLKLSRNDVVIVNSDIEVPPDWLSRLMYPIFEMKNIASATPMSNSSTLTSFPELLKSNKLYEGKNVEYIDAEFKKIKSCPDIYVETPTGHGFCMALSRESLEKVGYFDESAFGKGYGEENDWCMRAIQKGFKNVIAPNVFCFHNHTSSFTSKQRQGLIEKHITIIHKRYPNYSAQVRKTANNVFYKSLRQIILAFLYNKSAQKTIVCFTNSLGGGSMFANQDFIDKHKKANHLILNIRSSYRKESYQLEFYYNSNTLAFTFENIENIEKILSLFDIDEVVIHQLYGYANLGNLLNIISTAKREHGFRISMDVRDFFPICPTVQLLDNKEKYCHAPNDTDLCQKCISQLGPMDTSFANITQWRRMWRDMFSSVDCVKVYSNHTRDTILKIFGYSIDADKIELGHIPINYITPVKMRQKKQGEPINIGIIGNILVHKGVKLLNEMANIIHLDGNASRIKLFIIGRLDIRYDNSFFEHVGEYKRGDISSIIEEQDIDIIFMPSIWGETFCRTVQEAILMEVPVACFDLGAPPERVSKYDKGLIVSQLDAKVALNEIIEFVKKLRYDRENACRYNYTVTRK